MAGLVLAQDPLTASFTSLDVSYQEYILHDVHAGESIDGDVDKYDAHAAYLGKPSALFRFTNVQDWRRNETPDDPLKEVLFRDQLVSRERTAGGICKSGT